MTAATEPLATSVDFTAVRVEPDGTQTTTVSVATEVPLTIIANGTEIATLMCSPSDLKEMAYGFLFTSGVISKASDITSYRCDTEKWLAELILSSEFDPKMLGKRLYTSGCGKGVMYADVVELSGRRPLQSDFCVSRGSVLECMQWLQGASPLYRATGGVHSAALSVDGALPECAIDDVGRHNAVDKVIGTALLRDISFEHTMLMCTGRISSDILHKARRCATPVVLSRGAPTHQTLLLANDMGITVVGFARGGRFTIYSHSNRVEL